MSRWKASSLHLLASFIIVGGIALSALLLWYPHGLYQISGQNRLLLIMMGIDLVVGPLLTLVVYKAGKPRLAMDLTIIGLCQLAFLGYGLHTLWASRPVFLVASESRFNLVFANEIEKQQLMLASRPEWRRLSWSGPQLVGVKPPDGDQERQNLLLAFMASGVDIDKMPRLYVPYEDVVSKLVINAEVVVPELPGKARMSRVPIVSRYGSAWMLIDAETGKTIKVIAGRPGATP